eukprot:s48_g12.t1
MDPFPLPEKEPDLNVLARRAVTLHGHFHLKEDVNDGELHVQSFRRSPPPGYRGHTEHSHAKRRSWHAGLDAPVAASPASPERQVPLKSIPVVRTAR